MKIKKVIFAIILFCFTFSVVNCTKEKFSSIDISLGSIVELGIQYHRMSLILINELSSDDSLNNFIHNLGRGNDVICYKATLSQTVLFEKICGMKFTLPTCIVISGDSIFEIAICAKKNILRIYDFEKNIEILEHAQMVDTVLGNDINNTFRKKILLDRIETKHGFVDNNFDSTFLKSSCFYGKYLTACLLQYEKKYDESNVLFNELWRDFTKTEKYLYKDELIDIMTRKNALAPIDIGDIKFDHLHYNFGKLFSKRELVHSFIYKNMSSNKMQISDVVTTCGCTSVLWNKGVIAPGQLDSIVVVFRIDQAG